MKSSKPLGTARAIKPSQRHSNHSFFSVRGVEIALEYFENLGHVVKAVVPDKRLQSGQSSNPDLLRQLYSQGKIVFTPCKNISGRTVCSYDDRYEDSPFYRFILQMAIDNDGVVISNDKFRDLINENQDYRRVIETSVIGYSWSGDKFMLPKDPYGRIGRTLSEILNRK